MQIEKLGNKTKA